MFAGGILYLDSFRLRLLDQRTDEVRTGASLIAASISDDPLQEVRRQIALASAQTSTRIRIYAADGEKALDSWDLTGPTYTLRDPDAEPWQYKAARLLDRFIEGAVGAAGLPFLDQDLPDRRASYPEAERAAAQNVPTDAVRLAPDRTPIAYGAAPLPDGRVLTISTNARDITTVVRAERQTLFLIFLGVLALSLLLSSFLARTIVRPLRRLALAAQRVRLGRSREVTVPRFQQRRDEIGELARSLSDMTAALRSRIDATEAFAADVAHELKNPLASLRSAVEGLGNVDELELREELLAIVQADVARIDRLVSDISDASRLDAELSRARFEPVDMGAMMRALVDVYNERGLPRGVRLELAAPAKGVAIVLGEDSRLARVAQNLVDNAISFSREGGLVQLAVERRGRFVCAIVEDEGPGIPAGAEEKIFQRFYSERPEAEGFGRHSGLGLAISRAIVEAHDGTLVAENRDGGGARFTLALPTAASASAA